jgi:hypothetical protein
MKPIISLLCVFFAITFLGACIAGAYVALRLVIQIFIGLDAQMVSVLYAAVAVVLSSTVLVLLTLRAGAKHRRVEQAHVEKAKVYQNMIAAWSDTLSANTPGAQRALHREYSLYAAEQQLLLWGSPNVVRDYIAYQQHGDPRDPIAHSCIEKMLLDMRQDLGQSNFGLQRANVIHLLLGRSGHDDGGAHAVIQESSLAHRLFNGIG